MPQSAAIEILDPVNQPWTAYCEVCGEGYPNHAGSTPCCGSLAILVTDAEAAAMKSKVMAGVNELIGKERLLKKLTDAGVFKRPA